MESLAELRRRRLALGIPLGELARAVGRSTATVSRIERGRIRPSYDLVQKVVAYLDGREALASPRLTTQDVLRRPLISVEPSSSLAEASRRLEAGGFSQLPVVEDGRPIGSVSEASVLRALQTPASRRVRVRDILEPSYPVVDASFPADLLPALLTRYPAVLVASRGVLDGIVTKADLIRGLRGIALRRPSGG
ncbi:MAG TPA: CBS domain-containing protein [Thermoplasmata archaeon]|nr:CBS domain-containing protein [Thermoplasmata archaeon]